MSAPKKTSEGGERLPRRTQPHMRKVQADLRRRLRQLEAIADLGRQALAGVDTAALSDRAILQVVETLGIEPSAVPELLLLAGGPEALRGLEVKASYHVPAKPRVRKAQPAYTPEDAHFLQAVANILAEAARRNNSLSALTASRDHLDAILQGAADGILVQNVQGEAVYVNDAFTRMAGLDSRPSETGLENLLASFQALDESGTPLANAEHPNRVALQGRRSPTVVARVGPQGREERWVQYQATPIFDRRGQVAYTVTIATDITQAKRSEESWRFLADATRSLAASLDYGQTLERVATLSVPFLADYCLVDLLEPGGAVKRQIVPSAEEGDEASTGRSEAYRVFPGKQHRMVRAIWSGTPQLHTAVSPSGVGEYSFGPADLAMLRELGMASTMIVPFAGRGGAAGAITFVSGNRNRRYGEADLALARELVRSCALAVDNARLYQHVQEQQQALRTVLDSMTDGVIAVDLDMRIKQANAYAAAALSSDGKGIEDKVCGEVLSVYRNGADEPLVLSEMVAETIAKGEAATVEGVYLRTAGGAVLPVSLTIAPQRGSGKESTGAVLLFRDMTRNREVEQLRDTLISLMSHDLKTPLTHIKGSAGSLLQDDVDWDDGTRREFLQTIDQEADRLGKLVNEILEIAQVQAEMPLDLRPLGPAFLVQQAVDTARLPLTGRSLTIAVQERLPAVMADPAQIERVLVNLLDNACRYSPDGTPIETGARRRGEHVVFWVRDWGPGIPTSAQHVVFEKFVRLGPERPGQPPSSGLGLSLCKAVVEAHHGRIWVDSQPGHGATFLFTLVAASAAETRPAAQASASGS